MSNKLPISNELLVRLAGKPAFNRGMDYFNAGNVLNLKQNGSRITADVEGTEIYRVIIKWTNSQLDGACDCPASDGFDFCKHCVAVALTLRETQAEQDELIKGGEADRIRAYLLKQDKQKLANWLLEQIEMDRTLFQQWSMRADRDLGIVDLKALRKRITATIAYNRNYYRYNQVRNYFSPIEVLADHLNEMSDQLPAEDMLKLVDYALQRINRALETIDDSGGFRYYAVDTLQSIHINACTRLEWPEQKIAGYLLDIVFGEHRDLYPEIPSSYTDALGDSGLAAFNQSLQAKWDALPPLKQGADFDEKLPYLQLQRMLEQQASLSNDSQAIIRLKEKTATDLYDFQRLAEHCLEIGDYDAVEKWLKKCRHASERDYHLKTERLQLSLSIAKELWPEALEQQWQLYNKTQDLEDYLALLKLAQKIGDNQNWQEQAIQLLKKKSQPAPRWASSSTDKLLEIYLHHKAYKEALTTVKKQEANPSLLLKLAWKISDQPADAFPLFQRVIESQVTQSNNDAYHHAIKIMQEMAGKLQTSQQQQLMTELLAQMRQKYRAKRNFIKWLNEAFE